MRDRRATGMRVVMNSSSPDSGRPAPTTGRICTRSRGVTIKYCQSRESGKPEPLELDKFGSRRPLHLAMLRTGEKGRACSQLSSACRAKRDGGGGEQRVTRCETERASRPNQKTSCVSGREGTPAPKHHIERSQALGSRFRGNDKFIRAEFDQVKSQKTCHPRRAGQRRTFLISARDSARPP